MALGAPAVLALGAPAVAYQCIIVVAIAVELRGTSLLHERLRYGHAPVHRYLTSQ